jgi:phage gp36-like protein
MSYILTIAQLEIRFGAHEILEASDRERLGERDDAVVQAALDRAEDALEARCRGRYTLPLSPVGDYEQGLIGDIARYYLHENRAPEEVEIRYKTALDTLRNIGSGNVRLGAARVTGAAAAGAPQFSGDTPVMGRDNTSDY